jgi:two-component system sensor histidine kinase HydH
MNELFHNLINNAFESFEHDSGNIAVSVVSTPDALHICVKDSGQGMDDETKKRAFEPFFTRKAKGTGLGLAVCKQIVSLHDGKIAIDSETGKGTEVTVILPRRRGPQSVAAGAAYRF